MTTVAIMQPTYLPWCGYFDMLDQADVFVLLDTVQVSPKSWQTRNRIRARDGNVVWLSVPTNAKRGMPLDEVETVGDWRLKHWRSVFSAYSHAPHWDYAYFALAPWLLPLKNDPLPASTNLTYYTNGLVGHIESVLYQRPPYEDRRSFSLALNAKNLSPISNDPIERIADICRHVGATELLNTPGARDFLDGHDVGVPVRWHDYTHPTYSQGDAPFVSHLSVVDLLAWHGPDALDIIRSGRR